MFTCDPFEGGCLPCTDCGYCSRSVYHYDSHGELRMMGTCENGRNYTEDGSTVPEIKPARTSRPVFSDGKVHVQAEMCSTCIFRPGNLMHLEAGRVKEMVDGCVQHGGVIPCHKTTHGQAEQEATCRGFYQSYSDKIPGLFLAGHMGMIEEVLLSTGKD